MASYRDDLKTWLRNLARARGVSPTELASEAGLATTTITRFLNSEDWNHTLSNATLAKIELRWDTKAPRPAGLADAAAAGFVSKLDPGNPQRASHEIVLVTDDALNMRGYMRGDMCAIDMAAKPRRGDVVLAEIRTANRKSQRVLLAYDAPYLRGHSTDWELSRPVLIDAERVRILGVVVRQTRIPPEVA